MTYKELEKLVEEQKETIEKLEEQIKTSDREIKREGLLESPYRKKEIRQINLYETRIEGRCSTSVGVETSHKHNLPQIPKRVIITETSNGLVYLTGVDKDYIKVKSDKSLTTFIAYCII